MALYISKYRNFSVSEEGRQIRFHRHTAGMGSFFRADDDETIGWLERQPYFGSDFHRTDSMPSAVQSEESDLFTVNAATETILRKKWWEEIFPFLLRLIELLLKNTNAKGKPRRDSSAEELAEIQSLQRKTGIVIMPEAIEPETVGAQCTTEAGGSDEK